MIGIHRLHLFSVAALALASTARASLVISTPGTPYSIDFTGFTGAGFAPSPSTGQLDSDDWAVAGLSDGSLAFGGTQTTGDFARGSSPGGLASNAPGGIYAFDVDPTTSVNASLGIKPGGSDFTPGSFTLRLQNNTGQTITALDISYDVYVYNDYDRDNSFNFSHSADDSSYAQVGALDLTSPGTKDKQPAWVRNPRSTTLTGLSIANNGFYYLRWTGNDVTGSGNRDEFALDNISVTSVVPEPAHLGLLAGGGLLLLQGASLLRRRFRGTGTVRSR